MTDTIAAVEAAIEQEVERRLKEKAAASVPIVYTVEEAMGLLKVSRSTVYKLISDGVLRTAAVPRRTLIPASEIQRVLAVSA